jgi:hypothetical protein
MAARTKRMRVPPLAFFIAKYFGSGVIIATAFIHVREVQVWLLRPRLSRRDIRQMFFWPPLTVILYVSH